MKQIKAATTIVGAHITERRFGYNLTIRIQTNTRGYEFTYHESSGAWQCESQYMFINEMSEALKLMAKLPASMLMRPNGDNVKNMFIDDLMKIGAIHPECASAIIFYPELLGMQMDSTMRSHNFGAWRLQGDNWRLSTCRTADDTVSA